MSYDAQDSPTTKDHPALNVTSMEPWSNTHVHNLFTFFQAPGWTDSFLPILYCLKQCCALPHLCVRLQNKPEAESLGQGVYACHTDG